MLQNNSMIDPYCIFAENNQCDYKVSCFLCHERSFSKLSVEHSKLVRRIKELDEFVEALAVCENIEEVEDIVVNQIHNVLRDDFDYSKKEEPDEFVEFPRIDICSSHGTISFDHDGMDPKIPSEQPWSYLNLIARLDVIEWEHKYPGEDITDDEHDILDFACWDIYGEYEAAAEDWREELAVMVTLEDA